ncbi:MAG TPA: SUMF1/EgtB/PvdO family nonheme iron enzyme [Labilithrix sp.]
MLVVSAAAACSGILGLTDPTVVDDAGVVPTAEAGPDGSTPPAPPTSTDANAEADGPRVPSCDRPRGPTMIRITDDAGGIDFCIDSTEVTGTQYVAFLDAVTQPDVIALAAALPAVCRDVFTPPFDLDSALQRSNVASDGTLAVARVGWCQAQVYCAWAGKRLCGTLDGGAGYDFAAGTVQPIDTEWYFACTHGGARAYPYAASVDPAACDDGPDAAIEAPGAKPACVGGYAGLYDMVGNVSEWELGFKFDGSYPPYVHARGPWFASATTDDCSVMGGDPDRVPYTNGDPRVGIRCCASP